MGSCGGNEIPDRELARQAQFAEKVRVHCAGMRCYLHSYGCQQNVSDGERLKGQLATMGFDFTDYPGGSDLILFNTCAVRENAEDRVFGNIGELKRHKRENPALLIGVCGCMTQQPKAAERIRRHYPFVDFTFGANQWHRLPELLFRVLEEGVRVFDGAGPEPVIAEGLPVLRDDGVKAWLPVMYGCDNFCSYCIVPFVRGRERSRRPEAVEDEAREILMTGRKEITLLGQNVNSYGKGLDDACDFSGLLERLNALDGKFRLRFMTSHPKDCTHRLIENIAKCGKVCNAIHLPVQSGSDQILDRMNRRYTARQYMKLIEYARAAIPGVRFTSDIIVGFPGETEEDFRQTLDLVAAARFQSLFTFLYSPREGTAAAEFDDPVPAEEKAERFKRLLALQAEIGREIYEGLVGRRMEVLLEGPAKTEGFLTGRDAGNAIVNVRAPAELTGEFVQVKITAARGWALDGEIDEG